MTHPTPTQKSREAFEAEAKQYRLALVRFGEYISAETRMCWLLWQSAHQCGREEAVQSVRDLQQSVECGNDGLLDCYTLDQAIERIQGGK